MYWNPVLFSSTKLTRFEDNNNPKSWSAPGCMMRRTRGCQALGESIAGARIVYLCWRIKSTKFYPCNAGPHEGWTNCNVLGSGVVSVVTLVKDPNILMFVLMSFHWKALLRSVLHEEASAKTLGISANENYQMIS